MGKTKRKTILFSCLGSTDPVRGEHDGPMLHIARHYRPDMILWYMSKEMRMMEEKDNRYALSIAYLKKQCPGYEPEILPPCCDELEDASDFDAFYDVFEEQLRSISQKYPDAVILVNLSSGTPQMKTTLALLSVTLQFPIQAIQVKNFEKRSGTSERTTMKNYDLEYELELNEDADPDAPNRCSEPKLLLIQRDKQRTQIEALLRRYDYEALLAMSKTLPESLRPLLQHLAYRSAYNLKDALSEAKNVRGLELFPAHAADAPTYREYREVSEYILVLKLMQRTQRYTDLVIRLNPLVIRLQRSWLEKKGVDFSQMGFVDSRRREIMDARKIRQYNPELADWLDKKYGGFRSSDLNILFCNYLTEWIGQGETETGIFFRKLLQLNQERNASAHSLNNVTEEDIARIMDCSSGQLVHKLIALLAEIYPEHYQEDLFSIYDTANRRISETL